MTTPEERDRRDESPWGRYQRIRDGKGMVNEWICREVGLSRRHLWGMLKGLYGFPATPEKRRALVRVLNLGPGEPITESDIWPAADERESA